MELWYSNGNLKDNPNVYFFSGRARLAAEPLRHRSQFPDILPKPQPKSTDIKLSPRSLHKEDTTLGEMVYVNIFTRFFHFLTVDRNVLCCYCIGSVLFGDVDHLKIRYHLYQKLEIFKKSWNLKLFRNQMSLIIC